MQSSTQTRYANGISPDFEWVPEYAALLEQIASTDVVDSEWSVLRDMIKYKIHQNVDDFFDSDPDSNKHREDQEEFDATSRVTISQSNHSPPSSSPPLTPSTSGGLVLPPFPPRQSVSTSISQTLPSQMSRKQAEELQTQIFAMLEEFERNPPFTIQRLCELCIKPRQHYKLVGKYLRAIERSLLVTSTWDRFPPLSNAEEEYTVNPALASSHSLRDATTPLFSPIPFLHDDARSRSPSPMSMQSGLPLSPEGQPLGLVDELDDPKPGHLSERPIPLSVVTSLEERFIKGDAEIESIQELPREGRGEMPKDDANSKFGAQEEDKEVDAMV